MSSLRPTISDFAPFGGASGTSVTINGANLAGAKEVRFNTDAALFSVVSQSQLIATVPLEATTGPISVTTSFGTAVTFAHFVVAPRVTDFSPTNGSPGTVVILEGANFVGAMSVQFNGKPAAAFTVTAQNQIHATVPTGAASGPISVSTLAGTGTSTNNFIITGSEPFISDFSPAIGVSGTLISIEGRNFSGATSVKFNGTNAASFSVTAPTQISAVVPTGASTGPISVTTLSGTGISAKTFVITAAPIITEFSPSAGAPGTTVLVSGENLLGATSVKFNGVNAANFSAPASTQISAVVPQGASTGPISVITSKGTGTSNAPFIVTVSPVINEFAPTNGPAGTIVTIDGANFSGVTSVKLGNTAFVSMTPISPTQIRATVPAGATTGRISVTTPKGTGTSTNDFVVTSGEPILTGFTPAAGAPGISVTLTGINFTGATAVKFNGLNANFTVTAPTQIACAVPPGATSGMISVTTPIGTALSSALFFVAPLISSFSPTNGVLETPVTIRGTNFTQVSAVRFNGVAANFTSRSPNEISALVPTNATTGTISVTTPAGIIASTNVFTVLPEVTRPVSMSILLTTNNQLALSWPGAAWSFGLQTSDRFGSTNWTSLTNHPLVVGDRRQVILDIDSPRRFFRLFRP